MGVALTSAVTLKILPQLVHRQLLSRTRVTFVGWGMQFCVPASMEDIFESGGYKLEDRGARWIESYARLRPGVTLQQAQQEVAAISGRLAAEYPATNRGRSIRLWPLWQTPFNNAIRARSKHLPLQLHSRRPASAASAGPPRTETPYRNHEAVRACDGVPRVSR